MPLHTASNPNLLHLKYEVMDLRRPYNAQLKQGELLPGYWTGPGPQAAQCVVNKRSQRLEEFRRFGFRNATFTVLACDAGGGHGDGVQPARR